ncbi:hypothetical protein D3C87_1652620 [compost metagenome]
MGLHLRERDIVHGTNPESSIRTDTSVIQPAGDAFRCGNGMKCAPRAAFRIEDEYIHPASGNQITALTEPKTGDGFRERPFTILDAAQPS